MLMLSNAENEDFWVNDERKGETVDTAGQKNFAFYRFLELPRPMAGS